MTRCRWDQASPKKELSFEELEDKYESLGALADTKPMNGGQKDAYDALYVRLRELRKERWGVGHGYMGYAAMHAPYQAERKAAAARQQRRELQEQWEAVTGWKTKVVVGGFEGL